MNLHLVFSDTQFCADIPSSICYHKIYACSYHHCLDLTTFHSLDSNISVQFPY
nr:MAG TPA: hypothetical protein [Bacteriophage sp.]